MLGIKDKVDIKPYKNWLKKEVKKDIKYRINEGEEDKEIIRSGIVTKLDTNKYLNDYIEQVLGKLYPAYNKLCLILALLYTIVTIVISSVCGVDSKGIINQAFVLYIFYYMMSYIVLFIVNFNKQLKTLIGDTEKVKELEYKVENKLDRYIDKLQSKDEEPDGIGIEEDIIKPKYIV